MAVSIILTAFGKAVSQLADPRFRRVFLIGILLTVLLLIGAMAGFSWLIDRLTPQDAWLPEQPHLSGPN